MWRLCIFFQTYKNNRRKISFYKQFALKSMLPPALNNKRILYFPPIRQCGWGACLDRLFTYVYEFKFYKINSHFQLKSNLCHHRFCLELFFGSHVKTILFFSWNYTKKKHCFKLSIRIWWKNLLGSEKNVSLCLAASACAC